MGGGEPQCRKGKWVFSVRRQWEGKVGRPLVVLVRQISIQKFIYITTQVMPLNYRDMSPTLLVAWISILLMTTKPNSLNFFFMLGCIHIKTARLPCMLFKRVLKEHIYQLVKCCKTFRACLIHECHNASTPLNNTTKQQPPNWPQIFISTSHEGKIYHRAGNWV